MPYTGDKPSNPVALTLTAGEATGEATDASTHDRHVCWFSVPAQAAGKSIGVTAVIGGGTPERGVDLCMIWAGGNTAYYANADFENTRQSVVYLPLPTGIPVLIGVLPQGINRPVDKSTTGEVAAGAAKTALEWDDEFPPDLTRRLPAYLDVNILVETTVNKPGSAANPIALDFLLSSAPQVVSFASWELQDIHLSVRAQDGYAVRFADEYPGVSKTYAPALTCATAEVTLVAQNMTTFKIPGNTWTDVAITPSGAHPFGDLTVQPVVMSDVSGPTFDEDGTSLEPANVLIFRTQDAMTAVAAPAGTYTLPDIPEGDYIVVAFSQMDSRDVRATNVLIPRAERAVGGGYVFPPGPPLET